MTTVDHLDEIYKEQKDYDLKVIDRLFQRHHTDMGQVFGKYVAMQGELGEINEELKPYWQWWRGEEVSHYSIEISDSKRERLVEEHIDLFKFLLSSLITLGVDDSKKFYDAYMAKHKIIHQRLEDAKQGKDNYLVSETKSLL